MKQKLGVGDWVEVRSAKEILSTLDQNGTLDALPFMPEMLPFIGKQFKVQKRIHKTCDTIDKTGLVRMKETVFLEGLRCDGVAHGGCQARCALFWKQQWLKKLSKPSDGSELITVEKVDRRRAEQPQADEDEAYAELQARVAKAVLANNGTEVPDDARYRCLITEMKRASSPLKWWDVRHYWEDVTSGNRPLWEVIRTCLLVLFNWAQRLRGGAGFPSMDQGTLKKTPNADLRLQPGDVVQVKSPEEIVKTLDVDGKTRGLRFDVGMFRYCGQEFRVALRAHRFIDQKTGRMIVMSEETPCILLDGVLCHADYQKLCPRSEYLFWREAWLKRPQNLVAS